MKKQSRHWTERRFEETHRKAVALWGSVYGRDPRGMNDERRSTSDRLINHWHDNILCGGTMKRGLAV